MNDHFSIDLETLGTRYNAAILSIGVQQFDIDTGKLGETFYREIDLDSAIKAGKVTGSTLAWWALQGEVAKRVFGDKGKSPLAVALDDLRTWMMKKASNPKVMIEAYRLLVAKLDEQGADWNYPLHLGVTEAQAAFVVHRLHLRGQRQQAHLLVAEIGEVRATADAQAASMIGYVTMGMSLVPMIGPVIGGVLDEAFGWQANFGLLLALGLVVLGLAWADLGETATVKRISFGQQLRSYPGLLASRRFWGYCGAAAFASGCFYAYLGGAPFVGNQVYHLSSSKIGLLFAITAIGYMAGNFLAGRFSMRLGMNRMVLIGTLVTTAGLALLAVITALGLSGPVMFFGLTITMGLGNGIALPSANAGILSVRPELAGTASGLGGAIMIGGGAGLAALAGAILQPGSTEMPLVLLMLASSVASTICILAVIRRARALGLGA